MCRYTPITILAAGIVVVFALATGGITSAGPKESAKPGTKPKTADEALKLIDAEIDALAKREPDGTAAAMKALSEEGRRQAAAWMPLIKEGGPAQYYLFARKLDGLGLDDFLLLTGAKTARRDGQFTALFRTIWRPTEELQSPDKCLRYMLAWESGDYLTRQALLQSVEQIKLGKAKSVRIESERALLLKVGGGAWLKEVAEKNP